MTTKQTEAPKKTGKMWPFLIVSLLGSGVMINIVMMSIALSDPSFGVEKNYYKKAVTYDKVMAQEKKNQSLGWQVLAVNPTLRNRLLQIRLQDRKGLPLEGAMIQAEVFHNARPRKRWTLQFQAVADAKKQSTTHTGLLPLSRKGQWVLHLTVLQGQKRLTQTLRAVLR